MPVAAAIAGAAVIGGAVSLKASSKASKTAKKVAADNNALQQQIYEKNAAALAPFQDAGNKATPVIQGLLGLGPSDDSVRAFDLFKNSTGYQSRLNEGVKTVTAALGGRGLLDSGAAQKSLARFGQTFASNEFGNYLGALQGQQALGMSAAAAQAGVGQNYANSVSANNTAAGNASANAALTGASAINNTLSNLVSAYGYSQGLGSSYGAKPGMTTNPYGIQTPGGGGIY